MDSFHRNTTSSDDDDNDNDNEPTSLEAIPNITRKRRRRIAQLFCVIALMIVLSVVSFTSNLGRMSLHKEMKVIFQNNSNSDSISILVDDDDDQNQNQNQSEEQPSLNSSSLDVHVHVQEMDNYNSTKTKGPEDEFHCIGDRIQHEVDLHRGDYICSNNKVYMLGLNESGHFVWVNTNDKETKAFTEEGEQGDRWVLTREGRFVMHAKSKSSGKEDTIVWSRNCTEEVHFSAKCLPSYDCPYLHIHSDGVVVMNWIDDLNGWNERQIRKIFDLKWPK